MNRLSYLLQLKESNPREIYDTWNALGAFTATSKTKMYNKDNIYRIDVDGNMKNALVYCNYEYIVNPEKGFNVINWADADIDSTNNMIFFYQGVSSPCFKVLMSPEDYAKIDTKVETPEDFLPFANNNQKSSSITISDEEYHIICAELGIPFLDEDELEYNRDTIIDICIKPALDQYYAYFPVVIDEGLGAKGANTKWEVPYHSFDDNPTAVAYKAIPYLTQGQSLTGGGGAFGSGAFSYMRSEMMSGAMSGGGAMPWGGGLHYRKSVPGYVGMESSVTAILGLASRQALMNYFRREYERDVFHDGKKYASGYTSLGGCCLNIQWLCMDTDFSHIDYWMLPQVRKLCTAFALRNIGMLRSLIKPEDGSPIDFSLYTNRAESLEKEVLDSWKTNPAAFMFAIKRGGL